MTRRFVWKNKGINNAICREIFVREGEVQRPIRVCAEVRLPARAAREHRAEAAVARVVAVVSQNKKLIFI